MSLRQKIFKLFDVVISDDTSNQAALRELGRRGKLDLAKAFAIMFVLIEEIEELKSQKLSKK